MSGAFTVDVTLDLETLDTRIVCKDLIELCDELALTCCKDDLKRTDT